MRHRAGQLDMRHTLTANRCLGYLDTALLADDTAMFHALVFTAQALIVLDRAKDLGAEQPVPLRLEGAVVDGLGLFDLTVGPGANQVR